MCLFQKQFNLFKISLHGYHRMMMTELLEECLQSWLLRLFMIVVASSTHFITIRSSDDSYLSIVENGREYFALFESLSQWWYRPKTKERKWKPIKVKFSTSQTVSPGLMIHSIKSEGWKNIVKVKASSKKIIMRPERHTIFNFHFLIHIHENNNDRKFYPVFFFLRMCSIIT